ncbi:DUF1127 domain-containing protein [Roseovarius nanhaiticus]|uniref:YjiS-like domain-containing protein n=1 Tax=Roseovarius nanhaiticus TaxID=573024 RepID=A0A1N7H675_9RHOB|nr:DUF1127 domain-containing protein [Roseovarius nanhaiticus]SEL11821.1 protein of unknown function [Roseovarius nanhaiticus]SIS20210.1 protein of unknown function [Roseovarius nanhaiticus]
MSAIDFNSPRHIEPGVVGLGLTRMFSAFTAWNDARATRKALSALTDRELEDIGLTRGDVANFRIR